MDFLAIVSALCGWVYTLCWSLSFYPQPLLNARRRSTAGTTVDFPLINCLGFLAYLLSTASLRYVPTVRAEYAARHHGLTPAVAANDVAFAAHALVLSLTTLSQYLLPGLWGWRADRRGGGGGDDGSDENAPLLAADGDGDGDGSSNGNTTAAAAVDDAWHRRRDRWCTHHRGASRPSGFILSLMTACVAAVMVVALLALVARPLPTATTMTRRWTWLDVVYALGYVKLVITLVKYSPQVLANWRNRSTAGWSIVQILLDCGGGLLSIAQLLLDSYRQHDWAGVTGNPVKLALGNVSMAYDLVFMAQHYLLYPGGEGEGEGEGEDGGGRHKQGGGAAAGGVLVDGAEGADGADDRARDTTGEA